MVSLCVFQRRFNEDPIPAKVSQVKTQRLPYFQTKKKPAQTLYNLSWGSYSTLPVDKEGY
jgi:hypothetical protein